MIIAPRWFTRTILIGMPIAVLAGSSLAVSQWETFIPPVAASPTTTTVLEVEPVTETTVVPSTTVLEATTSTTVPKITSTTVPVTTTTLPPTTTTALIPSTTELVPETTVSSESSFDRAVRLCSLEHTYSSDEYIICMRERGFEE